MPAPLHPLAAGHALVSEDAVVDAETECSTVSLGVLFSHGICYFDVIGRKINRSNHKKRVIMI